MGKGRKLPTLETADFDRVLRADGWQRVEGTKHLAYEHPTKPGKVMVGAGWKNVKPGSWLFKNVLRSAQLGRSEFERLFWND